MSRILLQEQALTYAISGCVSPPGAPWDLAEAVHLSLLSCFYGSQECRTLAFSRQL